MIAWIKALLGVVGEYRKGESCKAFIRYRDGRVEKLTLPKFVGTFELPDVVGKWMTTDTTPERPRLIRLECIHYDYKSRFAIYEPVE